MSIRPIASLTFDTRRRNAVVSAFGEAHGRGRALGLVVEAPREHVRAGHRVVVISASLDALVSRLT